MKIMSVVGARPNFMKVAPIIAAINAHNDLLRQTADGFELETIDHVLVHTGQHYDHVMSDSFFADLNLPNPDVHLGVGSGSHATQTAAVMKGFETVLLREKPDVLVVVGDVNSTVACALVAAKVSYDEFGTRPLIAHVEAGLRSFDRTMPEEINRILTDQLADLLFVTEQSGLYNLTREGVSAEKIHFVGNTMIDSLLAFKEKAEASTILDDLGLRNDKSETGFHPPVPYALLTLHRPANVDHRDALLNILQGLDDVVREYPVVFPAHPRTQKRIREFGLDRYFGLGAVQQKLGDSVAINESGAIRMIEPLGYLDFVCLIRNAKLVITDSGGIQEETTCLGVSCVTVRENTERPVTVHSGTNVLAGVKKEGIREATRYQLAANPRTTVPELWDGKSAFRIVETITHAWQQRQVYLSTRPPNSSIRAQFRPEAHRARYETLRNHC